MKKTKREYWYYFYDGVEFYGFRNYATKQYSMSPSNGPFKSLYEAKADALAYFDFYAQKSREAKAEIRKMKVFE